MCFWSIPQKWQTTSDSKWVKKLVTEPSSPPKSFWAVLLWPNQHTLGENLLFLIYLKDHDLFFIIEESAHGQLKRVRSIHQHFWACMRGFCGNSSKKISAFSFKLFPPKVKKKKKGDRESCWAIGGWLTCVVAGGFLNWFIRFVFCLCIRLYFRRCLCGHLGFSLQVRLELDHSPRCWVLRQQRGCDALRVLIALSGSFHQDHSTKQGAQQHPWRGGSCF